MDSGARTELDSIKAELNSVIRELESISAGVRIDFQGIGNDKCADCIDKVLDGYYLARRKLNDMDTNSLTDSFMKAHGLGKYASQEG